MTNKLGEKSKPKLLGITELSIMHEAHAPTRVIIELIAEPGFDAQFLYDQVKWGTLFENTEECPHCGKTFHLPESEWES